MDKIQEYLELKRKMKNYHKQPIGNRIKQGGLLESRIKQVFRPERATQILTTTEDNFNEWKQTKEKLYKLREKLENDGIITYTEDGEEIIQQGI